MLPLDIVIWRLWRRAEENAIAALINRRSFVCVLASSVTGDDGGGGGGTGTSGSLRRRRSLHRRAC